MKFHTLPDLGKDATVSSMLSSSQGWSTGEGVVLRDEKDYDEPEYPNLSRGHRKSLLIGCETLGTQVIQQTESFV